MKTHFLCITCIVFACVVLSGCKSSPTPEKGLASDSADSVTTPAAVAPVTSPSSEISASERKAITLALGCAPESVTEKGCRECPSYEGVWAVSYTHLTLPTIYSV